MATAVLCLLLAQATADLEGLKHPSRAVREATIERLATKGPPSAELVPYVAHEDARVAAGVASILRLRRDAAVLPALARHADHPDPARADAAARLLVEIAAHRRRPLAEFHFAGMKLLPRRLERAVDSQALELLGRYRRRPSLERPQLYRPLYAGGTYAAVVLARLARDAQRPGVLRAHALHAYLRLVGRKGRPLVAEALVDPQPEVRAAGAQLAWRYGIEIDTLAGLLDSGRPLGPTVRSYAVGAAEHRRRLGRPTAIRLRDLAWEAPVRTAVGTAAALEATHPDLAERLIESHVERALKADRNRVGAGLSAGLFELRVGPLAPALRERLGAARTPLLRALVESDAEKALALVRPSLAPRAAVGRQEAYRVEIVYALLLRYRAPWADRVAFGGAAINREFAAARRLGARALRGAPEELVRPLKPRLRQLLADGDASVRLAAAAVLLPEPEALQACADALYDGDPVSAKRVAACLPAELEVDPKAPVNARRRLALRISPGGRDKE
ncbi:MAG: hypothetical protein ACYTG3_12625 [Planctomycetota bacterium]|jgi:hypothetical protein